MTNKTNSTGTIRQKNKAGILAAAKVEFVNYGFKGAPVLKDYLSSDFKLWIE